MASSFTQACEYDVFLSFRGSDIEVFSCCLCEALGREGIDFFTADFERGAKISLSLFRAIERSRLYVVILSPNYASSPFCLDELVKIFECKESTGRSVLPIFYKVDPGGIQGVAEHKTNFKLGKDKLEKWNSALQKLVNYEWCHIRDDRDENNYLYFIVSTISDKLNEEKIGSYRKELAELEALVADMNSHPEEVESYSTNFREKVDQIIANKVPDHAFKVIRKEITNLPPSELKPTQHKSTSEYLGWLIMLPWGKYSKETYDVFRAQDLLNQEYHGLAKAKRGILELIARGKFRGTLQGEVICLCGPPGVGKKSIARSLANLLNKNLIEWSMLESSTVAEIKGSQRSRAGARPGKIVKHLSNAGTANPLILINDIDKLGTRDAGEVAKALLELFDSNQNASFLDCYLGFPIDLSKALVVFTAKVIDNIPKSLLDKMDIISIAGYVTEEKVQIARDYLVKQIQKEYQLKPKQIEITEEALLSLIEKYSPESGVQILLARIENIYSKAILELMKGASRVSVDESNLDNFLGLLGYRAERIFPEAEIGVAMGLGLSEHGGSLFYIETYKEKLKSGEKNGIRVLGKSSPAMDHTAKIAYVAAASILEKKEPGNNIFASAEVSLRVHAGAAISNAGTAIPSDPRSMCCAIVTALLSLAMKRAVGNDLAITGEVTISGMVRPIDGIEERTIAAIRNKVKKVLFPKLNKWDFDMLRSAVREGLEVQFVDHYLEIFDEAFNSS